MTTTDHTWSLDALWALEDFIRESNRIEGLMHDPRWTETLAYVRFLERTRIETDDLQAFVWAVARARLRDAQGMNVRIGRHLPQRGGIGVVMELQQILDRANGFRAGSNITTWTPWAVHHDYETLHPFMDGNGRSGRALWLWMRGGRAPLGFLHQFYYDTLAETR